MKFIQKNDDINKRIGKVIHNERRKKGITQQEMAHLLGISRTTLSFYENGIKKINLTNLQKISNILDINIISLFNDENLEKNYLGSLLSDVEFELDMAIKHFLIANNKFKDDKQTQEIIKKIKRILLNI